MIRRPPRSTLDRSSAASDVYKRQVLLKVEVKKKAVRIILPDLKERSFAESGFLPNFQNLVFPIANQNMFNGAVSYTHLRAHETVLDLVCRLLLEKKKKKHTHT